MKKLLAIVLSMIMLFAFASCSSSDTKETTKATTKATTTTTEATTKAAGPELKAPDMSTVTLAAFSFKVNNVTVKNDTLKSLQFYKCTVSTTNSKGETTEATYGGFLVKDVLKAIKVSGTSVTPICSDGYKPDAVTINDYTLIAIEKDKAPSTDGTVWLAPLDQTAGQNYSKLVTSFTIS